MIYELLFKAFFIGVFVSAPMGPIGMLVIQRTLNKGRGHGLASGIGAMISDLFYALLTALGLGLVMDFITDHEIWIKLFGSLVMILFGIFIYRSNPVAAIQTDGTQETTYKRDGVTAFLLTLSNPLIIFLFIGLYARFNFFQESCTFWEHFFGILFIGVGAFCWWLMISYVFSKLRHKFNVRKLYLLNKIIGGIIVLFGIGGVLFSAIEAYAYFQSMGAF